MMETISAQASGNGTAPRIGYGAVLSPAGHVGYPSQKVLTRKRRRLDTPFGSGRAVSTLFQTAPGPLPAALFPEAEFP